MLKSQIKSYCKCVHCANFFETEKKKKYCSRKCQNRVAYIKKPNKGPKTKALQSNIVTMHDGSKLFIRRF